MALSKSEFEGAASKNLADLPEVAKQTICEFLDKSSLLNLRMTCVSLKKAVEIPCIAAELPVLITTSKGLQRVLKSNAPFNNFILNFSSPNSQSYFMDFIDQYANKIRNLEIRGTSGVEHNIFTLLTECSQIHTLEMNTIHLNRDPFNNEDGERCKCILKNLSGLTRLNIHYLRGIGMTYPEMADIKIFFRVLNNCRKLKELKVPSIETYNNSLKIYMDGIDNLQNNNPNREFDENFPWEYDNYVNPQQYIPEWNIKTDKDIVIHPIVDYIKSFPTNALPLKNIDVGGVKFFLWESFKDLVTVCYEKKITLSGMKSFHFQFIKNEIKTFDGKYFEVIRGIELCQIWPGIPWLAMTNLEELSLMFQLTLTNTGVIEEDCVLFPKLKSLDIQFISDECSLTYENGRLIRKLLKESKRPSMTKFKCFNASIKTTIAKDLVTNFENLSQLDLFGFDATWETFNVLWEGLLQLEIVSIKQCKHLNNKAFFGKYDLADPSNIPLRPFNRLIKLHTLIIEDTTKRVNATAIAGCFSWMKLYRFELYSKVKISWQLYIQLADKPLGKSMRYFTAPMPTEHSYYNEHRVFRKFKKLKKSVLTPGAGF